MRHVQKPRKYAKITDLHTEGHVFKSHTVHFLCKRKTGNAFDVLKY
jgi:hypothetical protein